MEKRDPSDVTREILDLLIQRGLLSSNQIEKALEESRRTGLSVEKSLEYLGYVNEEKFAEMKADVFDVPYIDLSEYIVDKDLINLIPVELANQYKIIPIFKINNVVTVGMVNPFDIVALDNVRKLTGNDMLDPVLVSEKSLVNVLNKNYAANGTIEEFLKNINESKISDLSEKELVDVEGKGYPIIKLVDTIITMAIKDKVSDIHIEPEKDNLRIRFRVDGILEEVSNLPKSVQNLLISRIKIMADMDISETRRPQDGRICQYIDQKEVDLRVSSFLTLHGENIVLRVLDKSSSMLGLKRVGFLEYECQVFEKLITCPNGIILVTGPTGSGKTSTLYSALAHINTIKKNIITIEDPVEYELPLVRQTQVNPAAGMTFANGLRSILRQDPDIIMVGEIRDRETAEIAVHAALTGHLVFSTLHTNDACSALTRLTDMGIEPFLISSAVVGIVAQRLVRKICEHCKEHYQVSPEVADNLGLEQNTFFYRGKGCDACKGTGYKGRMGIFEMIVINEKIKKMVNAKNTPYEIRAIAVADGMKTLRENGLICAQKGFTSLEEILTITEDD